MHKGNSSLQNVLSRDRNRATCFEMYIRIGILTIIARSLGATDPKIGLLESQATLVVSQMPVDRVSPSVEQIVLRIAENTLMLIQSVLGQRTWRICGCQPHRSARQAPLQPQMRD